MHTKTITKQSTSY